MVVESNLLLQALIVEGTIADLSIATGLLLKSHFDSSCQHLTSCTLFCFFSLAVLKSHPTAVQLALAAASAWSMDVVAFDSDAKALSWLADKIDDEDDHHEDRDELPSSASAPSEAASCAAAPEPSLYAFDVL